MLVSWFRINIQSPVTVKIIDQSIFNTLVVLMGLGTVSIEYNTESFYSNNLKTTGILTNSLLCVLLKIIISST